MDVVPMNNELYHHGILGMHWGVRRYQNPDGSLTDAGRRRQNQLRRDIDYDRKLARENQNAVSSAMRNGRPYRALSNASTARMLRDDANAKERELQRLGSPTDADRRAAAKRQREWNAQNASQLSDEELTSQILRLQREKQLKDLTSQVVTPGRSHARELLQRYGDQAIGAVVTAGITAGVTARINNKIKPEGKSDYDRRVDQLNTESDLIDKGYYTVDEKGKLRRTGKTDKIERESKKKK